jgi:3-phosphoshikimate 1-carboxyvinyltransferase
LRASGDIHIDDCDNVNTSFPGFVDACQRIGMSIETA